ncbi:MAG TPA: hypothetical protein VM553_15070 [Dongiaceae bacterium]|nr:hypothetical protein [Dongiaceae bacterium]
MPRKKTYDKDEVIDILYASEGRPSPINGAPGHSLSLHVNIAMPSDRLSNRLQNRDHPNLPIIMTERDGIADKNTHKDIWKELNPHLSTKVLKGQYDKHIDNHKNESGAFMDLQQAADACVLALNSPAVQTLLGQLDSGTQTEFREEITLPTSDDKAWKMRYAGFGQNANDQNKMTDIESVFLFVQAMAPDTIHIQTFYPIRKVV